VILPGGLSGVRLPAFLFTLLTEAGAQR